jgi:hypothetical protein
MTMPSVGDCGCCGGGGGLHSPDAPSDERYPHNHDRHNHHHHQPNTEIGTVPFGTHQSQQLPNGGVFSRKKLPVADNEPDDGLILDDGIDHGKTRVCPM